MSRTLQELAREALAVQDACNLSGVAHGFARAMANLGEHTRGTDERNTHPIAVLWADKIAHLTGTQAIGNDRVMDAYKEIYRLIEKRGCCDTFHRDLHDTGCPSIEGQERIDA